MGIPDTGQIIGYRIVQFCNRVKRNSVDEGGKVQMVSVKKENQRVWQAVDTLLGYFRVIGIRNDNWKSGASAVNPAVAPILIVVSRLIA